MGVGGTCAGWPKPTWQSGLGNPADGVRDMPDVSLFASNGVWEHYYVICWSDPNNAEYPAPARPAAGAAGVEPRSRRRSSPAFRRWSISTPGRRRATPIPCYYKLADTEYGASGSSACNSSNGNTVGSSCIFYDVTLGDIDADCLSGSPNCYLPSGTLGVLSTSTTSYQPAYLAQTGWDFATGLGTVNVYNLVTNWASVGGGDAGLTVSVTGGGTVTSNPAGISCASTCSHDFTGGSQVTLTPTPTAGWAFGSWGGACSGSGSCTVTMNAAESVTVTFLQALKIRLR